MGVALVKSLIVGSIDHRQAAEAGSPTIFIFGFALTVSGTTTAFSLVETLVTFLQNLVISFISLYQLK